MARAAHPRYGWLALAALAAAAGCSYKNHQGIIRADEVGEPSADGVPKDGFFRELDLACGVSRTPGAGKAYFHRQPYLQNVTSTSAEVLWAADGPGELVVRTPDGRELARARAHVDASSTPHAGRQYAARMTGLEPGGIHCYEILVDGRPVIEPAGFRTPPAGADGRARIIAIGDLGTFSYDQLMVANQMRELATDLVVMPGDVAYDSGKTVELEDHVFDVYTDTMRHAPFYPAAGNHDYETRDAAPLREAFALPENGGRSGRERWYSLDWGPAHIVVLDSQQRDPAQQRWLERDLKAHADAPWTIAVLHHPPYSSGHHGSSTEMRALFVPLFVRYGVDLVLSGHDHHYERTRPQRAAKQVLEGAVTYVVTGGGGRGTRRTGSSQFTAFSLQVSHLTYIDVTPETLRLYAIDGTGQEFDSLTLGRLTEAP